jgi:hypothetical protein
VLPARLEDARDLVDLDSRHARRRF